MTEKLPIKEDEVTIVIDSRELRSGVGKALDLVKVPKVNLDIKTLEVGDYVVSNRVGIERKAIADFWKSLLEERKLFQQLEDLADAYLRPILIIEGGNLFTSRQMNPNAVRGIINTITIGYRIPIIYTESTQETAQVILQAAIREQIQHKRCISLHGKRTHMDTLTQRRYIIGAICDVGPKTAINLLDHFKSVEKVMSASYDELLNVDEVGPITAQKIRDIVGGTIEPLS